MSAFSRLRRREARAPLSPVFLAVATLLAPALALAQADAAAPAALERVFVTATRTPVPFSQVLSEALVLNRADIERLGYGDLSDLLRSTGAFELARNGGPGQTSSLFLRGADSAHTMVLIDGVRVDTQSTGGAQWESLPVDMIERIEIVKGPASAIYGSDAIGGVVQIITRQGQGAPRVAVGVSAGSLRTGSADASVLGSSGIVDYALGARVEHSAGIQLITDPGNANYNPERAGYQKHDAIARLGLAPDAADRVELAVIDSHLGAEFNNYAPALGTDIEQTTVTRLGWHRDWNADWSTQAAASESRSHYALSDGSYSSTTEIRSYSLESDYRPTRDQRLLLLAERREDHLVDSSLTIAGPGAADRTENGVAAGWLWHLGALDLQAHARHDQDSEFGHANTGSLGFGWRLAQDWQIVGSVANAFRAPTVYQNTSIYGPLSVGAPSLKAESGHNRELGLRYDDGTSEAAATVFHNRVDNLINFGASLACASNSYGCYANVASAVLQGVTLSGSTGSATTRVNATLNWQSPKDQGTGLVLPRRAREYGSVGVQTEAAGWTLGTTVLASGERWNNAANTARLGGYTLVGLNAATSLNALVPGLRLQFNVDNALNHVYQTAAGYAQPGRTVTVSLRYSLGA